jgi:D-tyrosyl-tRNA(Tyr) deacylase
MDFIVIKALQLLNKISEAKYKAGHYLVKYDTDTVVSGPHTFVDAASKHSKSSDDNILILHHDGNGTWHNIGVASGQKYSAVSPPK